MNLKKTLARIMAIFFMASLFMVMVNDRAEAKKHYNCVTPDKNLGGRLFDFTVHTWTKASLVPLKVPLPVVYKKRITDGKKLCYENSHGKADLYVEMVGGASVAVIRIRAGIRTLN